MRQTVLEISALKVWKYFPKIWVRQNRCAFVAVFQVEAVIYRQHLENITCWSLCNRRFPRYWHSNFAYIFRKYGPKISFLGRRGHLDFLVGVLFHIIEAQYPSNVTTRYFRVLVLFLVYSLYAPLMRRSWTATTPYRHSKLGYFFAKYGWKTFLWGSQFFQ